jgi:hypothetical protein
MARIQGQKRQMESRLTLDDFEELVAYVKANRKSNAPFDIAVAGVTPLSPTEGARIVQPYIDNGATWWIEVINQWVGPFEEMRKRIRSGPPKA